MLRIFSKREKAILYTTIGVLIFALGFNFLIAPILTKNDYLNKEIALARAKLKKYRWLLSQKDHIKSKYDRFSSLIKLDSKQQDSLTATLSELENLAKNANIRIIDLRPQTYKTLDLYREILIDLRAEGTMEGYLNFIYNLENSLSLLRIKRFQFSAKPNVSTLEGNFSISHICGF